MITYVTTITYHWPITVTTIVTFMRMTNTFVNYHYY